MEADRSYLRLANQMGKSFSTIFNGSGDGSYRSADRKQSRMHARTHARKRAHTADPKKFMTSYGEVFHVTVELFCAHLSKANWAIFVPPVSRPDAAISVRTTDIEKSFESNNTEKMCKPLHSRGGEGWWWRRIFFTFLLIASSYCTADQSVHRPLHDTRVVGWPLGQVGRTDIRVMIGSKVLVGTVHWYVRLCVHMVAYIR